MQAWRDHAGSAQNAASVSSIPLDHSQHETCLSGVKGILTVKFFFFVTIKSISLQFA